MDREEWVLTLVLAGLILGGVAYESFRGAGKNAELILTHPGKIPIDPSPTLYVSPIPQTAAAVILPPTPLIPLAVVKPNALLLFLNSATLDQLDSLPGIGKVIAKRIRDYRQKFGPFAQVEDLLKVNGIGEAKLESLQQYFANPQPTWVQSYSPPVLFPTPRFNSAFRRFPTPSLGNQKPLSLNQATKDQLLQLPGIGESLAEAILHAKQKRQKFQSWQEVENIPGIGKHRLELLQSHFTIP